MSDRAEPVARVQALDVLRGAAIALVVLSHGWTLWPTDSIHANPWLDWIFTSGDAAVTVFLVASGFLLVRSISASETKGQMHPATVMVRRVIRVSPAMWLMLAVLAFVILVDPTDQERASVSRNSIGHALTYTYNWFVQHDLTATRQDLGHLWYVSVDMQAVVIVSVIAFLLRHRPQHLLAVLCAMFVLLVVWRFHSAAVDNIFVALNRTTARMDAFVLGAIAALLLPLLPQARAAWRVTAWTSAALLVPTLYWAHDDLRYLRWAGTVLELLVALLVVATALSGAGSRSSVLAPVAALGRASLVVYVWHFPIFHFVRRHGIEWEWDWPAKVLLAFALTAAIAWAHQVTVERWVSRLLAHPVWADARDGHLVPTLTTALVAGARSRRRVDGDAAVTPRS